MNILSKLCEGGWNIAYRTVLEGTILDETCTPFSLIPNTWRSWAADPFVFIHEGTTYVFAELFDYLTRKGAIGYSRYVDGKWSKWRTVIDESFHMSYPNIFSCNGQIYMVPETSADRSLRLYRATSFPEKWELEKVIATDAAWVDTTFFTNENRLYAITTDIREYDNQKDILLSFDNQWNLISQDEIPEKQNNLSRSGGNIIPIGNKKIRVTQDCTNHYGQALVFSRFDPHSLPDSGMGEILLQLAPEDISVRTPRKWTGLHTYNCAENIEVVDLERSHYNLAGLFGRLMWKIKNMSCKVAENG